MAEVTARELAWSAARAGFDALIVAGHEAGGRGGDESSFILLQAVLSRPVPPVWVRGGVGLRSASACVAAGAAGVVLDGALLLARESPLDEETCARIERWDGSETVVIGRESHFPLRVHASAASPVLPGLKEAAARARRLVGRRFVPGSAGARIRRGLSGRMPPGPGAWRGDS